MPFNNAGQHRQSLNFNGSLTMKSLFLMSVFLITMFSSSRVLAGDEENDGGGFPQPLEEYGIEFHARLEFEYRTEEGFDDTEDASSSTTNSDSATLDLDFGYQPCNWFRGDLLITWDDETPLEIDEGFVTVGDTETFPLFLTAGKLKLPFGLFETSMISDPLTQEIGEIKTYAGVLGFEWQGLYASTFIYDGSTIDGDDHGRDLKVFGSGAGYLYEDDDLVFLTGGGWVENIADADSFSEFLHEENLRLKDRLPGVVVYSLLEYGPFIFSAEYVAALEHIEVIDEDEAVDLGRPEAWSAELSYCAEVIDAEIVLALSYGESKSLGDLLPQKRLGGAVTVLPLPFLKLAVEYLREYDYSVSKGGTGDEADIVTFQLGLEY
jgi:hypothetical protein